MNHMQERIVLALLKSGETSLTRREIADRVGLRKTPHLIWLLEDLVERGVIRRTLGQYGGFSCWYYAARWKDVSRFTTLSKEDFMSEGRHG